MSVYKCHAFIFLDQPPPWPSRTLHMEDKLLKKKTKNEISLHSNFPVGNVIKEIESQDIILYITEIGCRLT